MLEDKTKLKVGTEILGNLPKPPSKPEYLSDKNPDYALKRILEESGLSLVPVGDRLYLESGNTKLACFENGNREVLNEHPDYTGDLDIRIKGLTSRYPVPHRALIELQEARSIPAVIPEHTKESVDRILNEYSGVNVVSNLETMTDSSKNFVYVEGGLRGAPDHRCFMFDVSSLVKQDPTYDSYHKFLGAARDILKCSSVGGIAYEAAVNKCYNLTFKDAGYFSIGK